MKLLYPLGGLMANGGSITIHTTYPVVFLFLLIYNWFYSDKRDIWVTDYLFSWWLIPTHLCLLFAYLYMMKHKDETY